MLERIIAPKTPNPPISPNFFYRGAASLSSLSFPSAAWECVPRSAAWQIQLPAPIGDCIPDRNDPPPRKQGEEKRRFCRSQALLGNASRQALLGKSHHPKQIRIGREVSETKQPCPLSFPSAAWECVPRSAASLHDSPPDSRFNFRERTRQAELGNDRNNLRRQQTTVIAEFSAVKSGGKCPRPPPHGGPGSPSESHPAGVGGRGHFNSANAK